MNRTPVSAYVPSEFNPMPPHYREPGMDPDILTVWDLVVTHDRVHALQKEGIIPSIIADYLLWKRKITMRELRTEMRSGNLKLWIEALRSLVMPEGLTDEEIEEEMWLDTLWISPGLLRFILGLEELSKDAIDEKIQSSRLELSRDSSDFLLGSGVMTDPEELHKMFIEYGEIFNIQRFILYRPINDTQVEIAMIFSSDPKDKEKVGTIINISENPNLTAVAWGKSFHNEGVDGSGIDMAFRVGGMYLWMDSVNEERKFTENEVTLLRPLALSTLIAYTAGRAIHLAGTDVLTGLWNRRSLDSRVDDGKDIFGNIAPKIKTIAFFDFDNFKSINNFGHDIGDMALCHIANILRDGVEKLGGTLYRYGGDEFAAAFPDSVTTDDIDQLRAELASTPFEFDFEDEKKQLFLTTSIGFCDINDVPDEIMEPRSTKTRMAIKLADQAVERSKKWGKNRVTQWKFADFRNESTSVLQKWIKRIIMQLLASTTKMVEKHL